jgi:hypothetical protein
MHGLIYFVDISHNYQDVSALRVKHFLPPKRGCDGNKKSVPKTKILPADGGTNIFVLSLAALPIQKSYKRKHKF